MQDIFYFSICTLGLVPVSSFLFIRSPLSSSYPTSLSLSTHQNSDWVRFISTSLLHHIFLHPVLQNTGTINADSLIESPPINSTAAGSNALHRPMFHIDLFILLFVTCDMQRIVGASAHVMKYVPIRMLLIRWSGSCTEKTAEKSCFQCNTLSDSLKLTSNWRPGYGSWTYLLPGSAHPCK